MNTATGLYTLIGLLLAGGIAGHFNSHPGDWNVIVSGVRYRLSEINHWFMTGDKEVVYPVALIIGLLVATAASWVMM